MRQLLSKRLKNQKGLTLIELLAVIVILGIIAAIAVPSIGNIMENSRKDALVANAQQMINASRLAYASGLSTDEVKSDEDVIISAEGVYTLSQLVEAGYMEATPNDPFGGGKLVGFVKVDPEEQDGAQFKVTLTGSNYKEIKEKTSAELNREDAFE